MTKKYEIALKYIKDLSIEIPDAKTFLFIKEYITKYNLTYPNRVSLLF